MMKYITHCLAVSLLFVAFSLNGQEVEISMDHPDRVNAGESFTVRVTIRKGSLTDYSRFSQDLPLGLTATNLSSPNADFSFDQQRIRIIWLKLPENSEISVAYSISVDERLKGSFKLSGVFAYIVNNDRKFLPVDDDRMITIVPSRNVDQSLIVDIKDFNQEAPPAAAATERETGSLMAVRQKPVLESTGAYLVHLLIDNPAGSKYAKVEETLPSGYIFEEGNSSGGIVSYAASTVKFIWMTLPAASEFEVDYRLVPRQNETQGRMQIEGLVTYTSNNENRVEEIKEMDVPLANMTYEQKRALLDTGIVPAGISTAPVAQREIRTTPTSTDTGSGSGGASSSGPSRFILNTRVLEKGTGVYYRVQLTANLNAFDATTLYRQAGVDREVCVEQQGGFYKYTVGPFQTYNEALSYRDRVERLPEIEGSFVVKYNNGIR